MSVARHSSFAALNDPKGLAGYSGYLLSVYELERRKFDNTFHEGGIQLVLVVICMISILVVYGWICALVRWSRDRGHSKVRSNFPSRLRGVQCSNRSYCADSTSYDTKISTVVLVSSHLCPRNVEEVLKGFYRPCTSAQGAFQCSSNSAHWEHVEAKPGSLRDAHSQCPPSLATARRLPPSTRTDGHSPPPPVPVSLKRI